MRVSGLTHWLASPQGRYVLDWELRKTEQVIADVFGYYALQIGVPQRDFLATSRITARHHLSDFALAEGCSPRLYCQADALPIASSSVDLVVLPHVLEFHPYPHQVLREVERILISEGQVVILGFNPFSLWGMYQRLPWTERNGFPWDGNYLSVARLKDWLSLLGFAIDRGAFGCYAPPVQQEKWLQRWQCLELAGDRWWGFASNVYLLRAIKRVHGMHLMTPSWLQANKNKAKNKTLVPVARQERDN